MLMVAPAGALKLYQSPLSPPASKALSIVPVNAAGLGGKEIGVAWVKRLFGSASAAAMIGAAPGGSEAREAAGAASTRASSTSKDNVRRSPLGRRSRCSIGTSL